MDKQKQTATPEVLTRELLLELGIPDRVAGHKYLLYAIVAVVNDDGRLHSMYKDLYPTIAEEYYATCSRVERSMRYAIEIAFNYSDMDTLYRYFGNTIRADKGKPTNSEFIARISNVVRTQI